MRLVVVRHGATANNLAAQFTGQLDVPLSPLGEQQALLLATALGHERFDALISSDLRRARATLAPLAELLEQPVRLNPALREIGVGVWEGHTGDEIEASEPGALARWESSETYAPEGGETVAVFQARIVERVRAYATRVPTRFGALDDSWWGIGYVTLPYTRDGYSTPMAVPP